jgi:hypothetical protein
VPGCKGSDFGSAPLSSAAIRVCASGEAIATSTIPPEFLKNQKIE